MQMAAGNRCNALWQSQTSSKVEEHVGGKYMNIIVKMLENSTVAKTLKEDYERESKRFYADAEYYGSATKAAANTSSEEEMDRCYYYLKGYSLSFVDHANCWQDCYRAVDIFLGLTD